MLENPHDAWPEKLKIIAFAYNTSQNKATQYSPYFLLHGREARVPNDLVFGTTSSEYYQSQAHLASKTYYALKEAWDFASKNIGNLQRQQKRYFDKTAKLAKYSVGDRVLVHLNRPKKGTELNKFKPPFIGPFKVNKVMDVNLKLVEESTGKKRIVHFDKARKIPNNLRPEVGVSGPEQSTVPGGHGEELGDEDSDSSDDDDHRRRLSLSSLCRQAAGHNSPGGSQLKYLEREIERDEKSLINEEEPSELEEDLTERVNEREQQAVEVQPLDERRALRDRAKLRLPDRYRC